MGILHNRAVLDADEIAHAENLGLEILPLEKPCFSLPCPRLEGTVCGVYGERPKVCRRYKCQLLQDFEAGRTPMIEATSRVAEARRLVQEVHAAVPLGKNIQRARRLALGADTDQSDNDGMALSLREVAALRVRATALEWFLDKHFRNSRDGRSFEMNSLEIREEKS